MTVAMSEQMAEVQSPTERCVTGEYDSVLNAHFWTAVEFDRMYSPYGFSCRRVPATASDASAATIESLRARLLAERAASKEARLLAQKISEKVTELQSRLNSEIENRRKALLAVSDVLNALKRKGHSIEQVITSCSSLSSEDLESEEIMAFLRESKGTESEYSSNENARGGDNSTQDTADPVPPPALHAPNDQEHYSERTDSLNQLPDLHHDNGGIPSVEGSPTEGALLCSHSGGDCRTMDAHEGEPQRNQIPEEGQRSEAHNDDCKTPEESDDAPTKDSAKPSPSPSTVDESATKELDGKFASVADSIGAVDDGKDRPAATSDISRHYEHFDALSGPQIPYMNGSPGFMPPDGYLGFSRTDGMSYNAGPQAMNDHMLHGLRPYDIAPPTINDHKLHDLHAAAEAPFLHAYYGVPGYFASTKYPGIDADPPMSYGASIMTGHESAISLVDDKNGKLGDILTALRLARQQLTDRAYASTSFKDDACDSSFPAAFSRNARAGYFTTATAYPQPIQQQQELDGRKEAPMNPIVHLPPSPTSDQGISAFERDAMFRNGADYVMAGYDSYLQPKGEIHLGNGITLYTD